jgi:hypothetical protein
VLTRLGGVSGEGPVGVEVFVALDGGAEWAAQGAEFGHADESQFGVSHAEIAETEGNIVAAEFGEEPSALGVGVKSFTTGLKSMPGRRFSMRSA